MHRTKDALYRLTRALERFLPLTLLWLLLLPLSAAIAMRMARGGLDRVPASALPLQADHRPPSYWRRIRYFTRLHTHWWLLGLLDRLSEPRWQRRFMVNGLHELTAAVALKPVVVVSVHTTALVVLSAWVNSVGIRTAAAPADRTWFSNPARLRRVALAEQIGATVFRRGSVRDVLAFMRPGRAIILSVDHPSGRTIDVPWSGGSIRMSTAAFRLARSVGADVVPVAIQEAGPWRYAVTVFPAVPAELVEAPDHRAAGRVVADQLLPVATSMPALAMPTLVEALR